MQRLMILVLVIGYLCSVALAQEVSIPNLIGLSVPQAAAELNRIGLRLGVENSVGWTADSGLAANTISIQSILPQTNVVQGTAVDITVLRSPNIALIYDDNDLTMINLTDANLDIQGLSFATTAGTAATFAATRWTTMLEGSDCSQVWSVGRSAPKEMEGCDLIYWLTTNKTIEHFWTSVNGATEFAVMDNGRERTRCEAAPPNSQDQPLRCEAYISGGANSSDITEYVYFAYTPEAFVLLNPTADRWMLTNQTMLYNYNPNIAIQGAELLLGDLQLFNNPNIIADITRLAPRQCLLLTSDNPAPALPETCDVIAQLDLTSGVAFWLADFQVAGIPNKTRYPCPAAVADKTTICVMPR